MTATATEPWTTARHPLARLLRSVAAGQFPDCLLYTSRCV